MSIIVYAIWLMLGIIFGPSVALYLAYDCKGYFRILENRFWDNVEYYIWGFVFAILPLWLLFFTLIKES